MGKDNLYCFEQLCENCSNLVILELIELRTWKEKARPFLEDQYYAFKNELECEGEFMLALETRAEYEGWYKLLTELLGGDDENN